MTALSGQLSMPPENLVQPEAVRRLAWTPPAELTPDTVAQSLRASAARPWQVAIVAEPLAAALPEPPADVVPEPPADIVEQPAPAASPAAPEPLGEPAPPGPPPFSDS